MSYKFHEDTNVGQWEIAHKTFWVLKFKPNWRTRFMAKIFLGWTWIDLLDVHNEKDLKDG